MPAKSSPLKERRRGRGGREGRRSRATTTTRRGADGVGIFDMRSQRTWVRLGGYVVAQAQTK
jgi:hypothetical protein